MPDDISVAGFDGIDAGEYYIPSITTIRQPVEQLAAETAKMLFSLISGKEEPCSKVYDGGTRRKGIYEVADRAAVKYLLFRCPKSDSEVNRPIQGKALNGTAKAANCRKSGMAAQLNDTVGIYPQQYEEKKNGRKNSGNLKKSVLEEIWITAQRAKSFEALMVITKQEMAGRKKNTGSKKLYYISAEFLIGKLLSNNLINLGMYEEVEKALAAHGRELTEIEEMEMEPSLGNGGLGRLAACFLDSIATLGLPGDGIGLNYHFGLFRQLLVDHKQKEVKNPWITNESWLVRQPVSFAVPYKNFTMHSTLYDIDVPGYNNGCNRLHLFDVDTVDESIVPSDSINFDKHQIQKNLTLFLYPDDSDRAGQLLRIYQQYFMVSNGAQFILMECEQKGYDLHKLYDHVVIQINDTHPSMVIPELIRLLQERGFTMQEAIDVVSKTCAYTNHTILAEALEKWPIDYLEEVVPHLMPIIHELDAQAKKKYKDEKVAIIDKDQRVHMAHMDIHYGFSVNGVAALHTEILKNSGAETVLRYLSGEIQQQDKRNHLSAAGCCTATVNWHSILRA